MKVSATDSQNVTAGFILKDREENILVEKSLQLNKENDHLEGSICADLASVRLWDNHNPYLYHCLLYTSWKVKFYLLQIYTMMDFQWIVI